MRSKQEVKTGTTGITIAAALSAHKGRHGVMVQQRMNRHTKTIAKAGAPAQGASKCRVRVPGLAKADVHPKQPALRVCTSHTCCPHCNTSDIPPSSREEDKQLQRLARHSQEVRQLEQALLNRRVRH